MTGNAHENSAFSKSTPSVFCVASPLQALCAIEAICDFGIDNYKIYVVIMPTEVRKEQIANILEAAGYEYKLVMIRWYFYLKVPFRVIFVKKKYSRVFIGHILSAELLFAAIPELAKGANVVYLDDGTASLSILYDFDIYLKKTFKVKRYFLKIIAFLKRITLSKYVYTIYGNIENTKYVIRKNTFRHIVSLFGQTGEPYNIVLFIGTNPPAFCEEMGIQEEEYFSRLDNIMEHLRGKYHESRIVYITHGRDKSEDTMEFCKKYSVEYQKLDVCVELHLLRSGIYPLLVLGFGSSALYNIKCMYPMAEVFNVMFRHENRAQTMFDVVTSYYEKNGIKTIWF